MEVGTKGKRIPDQSFILQEIFAIITNEETQ